MHLPSNAILRRFGEGSYEVWIHTVLPLHVALEISAMVSQHGVQPPANDDEPEGAAARTL